MKMHSRGVKHLHARQHPRRNLLFSTCCVHRMEYTNPNHPALRAAENDPPPNRLESLRCTIINNIHLRQMIQADLRV